MTDVIVLILLVVGTMFVLLSAIGINTMPDIYHKLSATTKATTIGIVLILIAVIIHFNDSIVTIKALSAILLLFITAPIGAQMLARAAYRNKSELWEKTLIDEMKDANDV